METQEQFVEPKKASFMESVGSGIRGYVKGFLAGGFTGAVTGAVLGSIAALAIAGAGPAILAASGAALGLSGVAAGAAGGAILGGAILAGIGALAGTVTGVVESREKNQVTARDVVNVAAVSYAQGMGVGHSIAKEQEAAHETQTHFRDKILKEREARAQAQHQIH